MKFKGIIVITDPCYIIRKESHGTTPITEDDWSACSYGSHMKVLGINHYITESTLYGDWGCTVYATENPKETVDKLAKISEYFSEEYEEYEGYEDISEEQHESLYEECDLNLNVERIGCFCADAGLVSVFLLDEVLAYNPCFLRWAEEHSGCAAIIKDFDGDVEYYVDAVGDAHIIGIGSVNFFTTQTAL